jgi:peroxiredoxin
MHDPRVPETLEGWWLLHQMFKVSWPAWQALPAAERQQKAAQTARALGAMERGREGSSVPCTLLGHKGDLMLIHFRRSLEELESAQLLVGRLDLAPFLQATTSYVSVVELGMYEMTAQIHARLAGRGLEPASEPFELACD